MVAGIRYDGNIINTFPSEALQYNIISRRQAGNLWFGTAVAIRVQVTNYKFYHSALTVINNALVITEDNAGNLWSAH